MVKTIFEPQETPERFANVQQGQCYSAPFFELDPTAIDDLVVYFKNTGAAPLEIYRIRIVAAVALSIQLIEKVTGTAAGGGTTRTAVNMDLRSGETKAGSIEYVTDPDITGLTVVGTLDTFGQLASAENTHEYPEGIILGQDNAIAIGVAVATSIISGQIFFMVHPEGE